MYHPQHWRRECMELRRQQGIERQPTSPTLKHVMCKLTGALKFMDQGNITWARIYLLQAHECAEALLLREDNMAELHPRLLAQSYETISKQGLIIRELQIKLANTQPWVVEHKQLPLLPPLQSPQQASMHIAALETKCAQLQAQLEQSTAALQARDDVLRAQAVKHTVDIIFTNVLHTAQAQEHTALAASLSDQVQELQAQLTHLPEVNTSTGPNTTTTIATTTSATAVTLSAVIGALAQASCAATAAAAAMAAAVPGLSSAPTEHSAAADATAQQDSGDEQSWVLVEAEADSGLEQQCWQQEDVAGHAVAGSNRSRQQQQQQQQQQTDEQQQEEDEVVMVVAGDNAGIVDAGATAGGVGAGVGAAAGAAMRAEGVTASRLEPQGPAPASSCGSNGLVPGVVGTSSVVKLSYAAAVKSSQACATPPPSNAPATRLSSNNNSSSGSSSPSPPRSPGTPQRLFAAYNSQGRSSKSSNKVTDSSSRCRRHSFNGCPRAVSSSATGNRSGRRMHSTGGYAPC